MKNKVTMSKCKDRFVEMVERHVWRSASDKFIATKLLRAYHRKVVRMIRHDQTLAETYMHIAKDDERTYRFSLGQREYCTEILLKLAALARRTT